MADAPDAPLRPVAFHPRSPDGGYRSPLRARRNPTTPGGLLGLVREVVRVGVPLLCLWSGSASPRIGPDRVAAGERPGSLADSQDNKPAALAPLPTQIPAPADNPTTTERVELGRMLFFDRRLSGNNTQSCATCHDPRQGWTEGVNRTRGSTGVRLTRNTPSVLNVAFQPRLFWDGRAASLEEQALGPIMSVDEMNQDLATLERELEAIETYRQRFQRAYGTTPTRESISRALAAFQRSLVTAPAPFDRFLGGDPEALSDGARRGYELFIGEAGCVRCHSGPLLSDGKYHRLGVSFRDPGRAQVTGRAEDKARFRTPSLRNVAQTAPYMHDGSLKTLTDVVTFYYRGIPPVAPDNLPLDIRPRSSQSFSEVADLVEFLESLTGEPPPGDLPAPPD